MKHNLKSIAFLYQFTLDNRIGQAKGGKHEQKSNSSDGKNIFAPVVVKIRVKIILIAQ